MFESTIKKVLLSSLLCLIIPNIIFWLICWKLDIFRPIINMDYLFVCLTLSVIMLYKNNIFGIWYLVFGIWYLTCFIFDLFYIVNQIYPLAFISDIFILIQQTDHIPYLYVIMAIVGLLGFLLNYLLLCWVEHKISSNLSVITIFSITLIFSSLYVLGGSSKIDHYINTSQIFSYILTRENIASEKDDLRMLYPIQEQSPIYSKIYKMIHDDGNRPNKIFLIVNESYGSFKSELLNRDIIRSLEHKQNKLRFIETGYFSFTGITKDGELRELCNKGFPSLKLGYIIQGFESCLPNIATQHHYQTFAFHAASGNLYSRNFWYPRIGFQRYFFDKDFMGLPQCKTFNGKCDHNLIAQMTSYFSQDHPTFIYWLTLNTHQPYDEEILDLNRLDCALYNLKDDTEICRNAKVQAQFFDLLAEYIEDKAMSGVDVYVVGDHPPPIINLLERRNHLDEGQVAWVHFKIK